MEWATVLKYIYQEIELSFAFTLTRRRQREREGESISVATQFAMKVFLHSIRWNINADFRWTLKDKAQSVTSQGVKWLPRKKLNHFRVYEWRMIFLLDGTRSSDQFTACNSPRIFVDQQEEERSSCLALIVWGDFLGDGVLFIEATHMIDDFRI